MRKQILLAIGAFAFIVSAVLIARVVWSLGLSSINHYITLPDDDDKLNENIVLVEDSIEWKLISPSNDQFGHSARISIKFVVRNPTSEDIVVDAYDFKIRFFDAEGFALDRSYYSDEFTVLANSEVTYSSPYNLRNDLGEQVAFIEVLGMRSK
ncbi:MAG: hypothetical protein OXO54_09285 [Chloroflexota bacterium]|nr:hypothetical protein [Chloroflexota bacterium]MDE2898502.1 hypothetical protein [Chloroflexota bacterium]